MTTLRILTAFANAHAKEAEAAVGFPGRAAYVYEHESAPGRNMRPCRAFIDSKGNTIKEQLGFPTWSDAYPDLSAVAGSEVLCLNAEFYGPEWEYVCPMMRAIGLDRYRGDKRVAQECLIDKLQGFAREGSRVAKACGLYGFAPLVGTSDERLRVLMQVTAWMPSLYVLNSAGAMGEHRFMVGMPAKETIPIIYGGYVYEPGPATVDQWETVLFACVDLLGSSRCILWHSCDTPESVEQVKVTGERMREAAKALGVELV